MVMEGSSHVEPSAVVEDQASLSTGVSVWHFAHVRRGAHIGADTTIGKSVYIDEDVTIGARCKIQNFVSIYRGVVLEDEVFIGPSVTFTNDRYPRAVGAWVPTATIMRRGASIGANATLLCGITVGRWAVVAAGAVVVDDVDPHRVVAGNPGRPIGWACRCGHTVPAGPGTTCRACGTRLML